MQNRCETQFTTIHFRNLTLICWRERKSTKGIEKKKQVDITIRRVFGSKMLKKHEFGDENGDTKKERKRRHKTI